MYRPVALRKSPDEPDKPLPDCTACRLIGGFGSIGISLYFLHTARKTPGLGYYGLSLCGAAFGVIGTARLMSWGPFNSPEMRNNEVKPD